MNTTLKKILIELDTETLLTLEKRFLASKHKEDNEIAMYITAEIIKRKQHNEKVRNLPS